MKPEITRTKEVDVVRGGGEPGKTVQEELHERREAVEQIRKDKEKPRDDFMLTGKGKASEHFDVTTNREFQERMTNQDGAPESVDSLSESAREKWLRTGELPEKKPNGKAAEKKAEPQAQEPVRPRLADFIKDGQTDNEGYEKALDRYEQEKAAFKGDWQFFTREEIDKEIFEWYRK